MRVAIAAAASQPAPAITTTGVEPTAPAILPPTNTPTRSASVPPTVASEFAMSRSSTGTNLGTTAEAVAR